MSLKRTSADRGASLRGRVLARLRAERGDTLVEVLIAALMVALIATASLGGFSDVGKLSETQRNEEQAATLAQQDQARLRGLTITQLSSTGSGTGNTASSPFTTQIDGTGYKVVSTAAFISGSTGSSACSGSNGADEVQTTSTVTWGAGYLNGGRNPVVVHGLITPAEGGAEVASVVDPTGAGIAGVIISMSGPTAVTPVTTDSSGCVIWTGLAAGSYTVSYTLPAGTWVTPNSTTPSSQSATITAGATNHTVLTMGQAASIQATFTTKWAAATVSNETDTFVLSSPGLTPSPSVFGTDDARSTNTFVASLSTSNNLYPYQASDTGDQYQAFAGGCAGDNPGTTNDPGFSLTAGQVNPVTVKEPALIVDVYGNTYDDTNAGWTWNGTWTHTTSGLANVYNGSESHSSTTNSYGQITFTGTSVTWIATYGPSYGIAKVYIDGSLKSTVDTYSSSTTYQKALTLSSLGSGSHTLKILVSGSKNSSSTGTTISIDAVNVPGSPALETIAPTVGVTDDNTGCSSNVDYPPTVANETAAQGALQFPGEIYGNLIVCADNGTYKNTSGTVASPVVNTSFTTGKVVTINIYDGASGRTAGTC